MKVDGMLVFKFPITLLMKVDWICHGAASCLTLSCFL